MKLLNYLGLICAYLFVCMNAQAFHGHSQFKVEKVKPWGEYGYRAFGQGTTISEMRFDCAASAEKGLILTVVNKYGKASNLVLPSRKLGTDKVECKKNLEKYFAGINNSRKVASNKDKVQPKMVELNVRGGFFTDDQSKKTLSFF